MSKGFNGTSLSATRRLILHEKAHFIYWELVDEETKNDWIELGGWFPDPTAASGYSTWKTTESVSAYGHANGPGEILLNPLLIMSKMLTSLKQFQWENMSL